MRILVTGATGYVGSRLITELLSQGHEVVATSRNVERLADFGWHSEVTAVALDAHEPDSVRTAFAEAGPIDIAYYLVHGIGQPDFRDADNFAAGNFAEAAKGAGVRRIVYLGGFVPEGGELSEHLDQQGRGGPSVEHRGRPRGGLAGRGDDHRSGIDVVRDAALRRGSLRVRFPRPSG